MWPLPGPVIEPVLPALAGEFLTTQPLGKPFLSLFLSIVYLSSVYQSNYLSSIYRALTKAMIA